MNFGLVIATGREQQASQTLDRARRAEAAGCGTLWTYEDYAFADAFVTLGALATATTTARIGTAVTNPFTRNPVLLAMSAATVDRFCGGRMVLGIGRSLNLTMKTQYGIEFASPYQVLEDTIPVLKRLWRGEEVSVETAFFTLRQARLDNLPANRDLPVLVASLGPRAFRLAGRVADGVIFHIFATPSLMRDSLVQFESAARSAGRDPSATERVVLIPLVLTEDVDRYRDAMRQRVAFLLSLPGNGDQLALGLQLDGDVMARVREAFGTQDMIDRGLDPFTNTRTPERMAAGAKVLPPGIEDQVSLMGTAGAVKTQMQRFIDAGATSFMLELMTEGVEVDQTIEQLRDLRG